MVLHSRFRFELPCGGEVLVLLSGTRVQGEEFFDVENIRIESIEGYKSDDTPINKPEDLTTKELNLILDGGTFWN